MKYIKQILLAAALLALLICCFAFTVSATPLTVDLSLNGVTQSFAYNAGDTWADLVGEDLWFGDDQCSFELIDDYIVLRVVAHDGSVSQYSLYIYDDNMPVYELVMPEDAFSGTADYRLAPYGGGEITFKLDGVFEKHYYCEFDLWSDLSDSSFSEAKVAFVPDLDNVIDEYGREYYVLFVLDGTYAYRIRYDVENQLVKSSDSIKPSTYNLELAQQITEGSTISVDLNGQTCAFFYGSEVDTFAELISSGTYSHPILGTCRWEVCDGYITLVMLDYEEPLHYFLVVADPQYTWWYVPEGAEIDNDLPYSLSVEVVVNVGIVNSGLEPYVFIVPSYVRTWGDVLVYFDEPFDHPKLGRCRFYSENDYIWLDVLTYNGLSYDCKILTPADVHVIEEYDFLYNSPPGSASFVFLSSCASHTYAEGTVEVVPTCTSEGSGYKICTVCGFRNRYPIPALGHNYYATGHQAATCEHKGFTKYTCIRCGDTYNEDIPQLHHMWNIEVIQEPKCEVAGSSRVVCESCGFASEPYEVAALGHQAAEAIVVREPTCTEAGVYSTYCERCGYAWEYDVRQRNHEYDWKGTCQFCGYNKITGAIVDGWNKVKDTANDFLDGLPGGDDGKDPLEEFNEMVAGLKDALATVGDVILTIVFLFIGFLLLPLLWPLIKVIIEGITFAVKTVVSLSKKAFSSLSEKAKKRKKKGKK